MSINLYPWNMYILYAALAVLVITLFATLLSLVKTLKQLKTIGPNLAELKAKAETVTAKAETASGVLRNAGTAVKNVFTVWVVLSMLKKQYDREEENGFAGISTAAGKLLEKQSDEARLIRRIRKKL